MSSWLFMICCDEKRSIYMMMVLDDIWKCIVLCKITSSVSNNVAAISGDWTRLKRSYQSTLHGVVVRAHLYPYNLRRWRHYPSTSITFNSTCLPS